jgi:formyltetrahydrofolate-dependent phosphoribosylglycinamide formyltransferase
MRRLVVMASGEGTTFQAILDACRSGRLDASVVALGVDRQGTGAQRRADSEQIPVFVLELARFPDRVAFDEAVAKMVGSYAPDVLVLAGYMKVLGPQVFERFRTINTHPALLPSFPGAHGVADALAHGVKVTGATAHWVDGGVDTGRIIAQVAVDVHPGDTVSTLRRRIQAAERGMYVSAIGDVLTGLGQGSDGG